MSSSPKLVTLNQCGREPTMSDEAMIAAILRKNDGLCPSCGHSHRRTEPPHFVEICHCNCSILESVGLYPLPEYLRSETSPVGQCNRCLRKTWSSAELGTEDRMPQPDGNPCGGRIVASGVVGNPP